MSIGRSVPDAALTRPRSLLDSPLLPWGLVALGLIAGFASPLGEALRALRLPDTDDAMRLAQVRDLVAGQPWFDLVQHRFLPPQGVASHWSRLIDAPLAAGIAGLTPLVGASLAERLSVALWPLLLLAAYAAILLKGMAPLFGRRAAVLALFAATQTIALLLLFAPGRIDHHNVQVVVMLGAALSLMQPRPTWRTGALAGGLCALSLAVGLEALPLVAVAGLVVAADWIRVGREALPALLGFSLSLWLAACVLFGMQTAPALWAATACDALSPPWLWLAATGPALGLSTALLSPTRPAARLALGAAIGVLGLAGFALLFPACLHGPFSGMPESLHLRWLGTVSEMLPFATMLRQRPAETLGLSAVLFAATLAAFMLAYRSASPKEFGGVEEPTRSPPPRISGMPEIRISSAQVGQARLGCGEELEVGVGPDAARRCLLHHPHPYPSPQGGGERRWRPDPFRDMAYDAQRRALGIAGLFLAAGSVLTVFQMRGIYVASGFVPLMAGICLDRALALSGPDAAGARARTAFLIAALALNAQAWLATGRIVERIAGLGADGTAQAEPAACTAAAGLAALDTLAPGTVLAPIDLGPSLLVHTHHAVVAAPYHRAPAGLMAGLAATDGDEAELVRQAGLTGATYLALCPSTKLGDDPARRSFAARLARGEASAPWLEPLAVPGAGLKVWRIR